jgi:glycosyltransferase involved in cell wall biosynthesis
MTNAKRQTGEHEKDASEWRNRVEILERSLQQELRARSVVERELYEIKSSLAWTLVTKFRRMRNRLFPQGTKYRVTYDFVRDFLKIMVLNPKGIPQLASKTVRIWRKDGLGELRRYLRNQIEAESVDRDYPEWIEKYGTLTDSDRGAIKRHIDRLSYQPLISLIMPTYNSPEKWLRLAIESVLKQRYPNWELCIADDASNEPHVRQILEEYRSKDSRIKINFRQRNGHMSAASNTAIEMARGEFIGFLDHDDELSEHALYVVVADLNVYAEADLIYSDEDKIDNEGRRYDPYFKPDWNPALFLAQNFMCHFAVYRTRIVKEIGGLREGYEGAQDWDLAMRLSERVPDSHIRHIPHILYHWRAIPGSAALDMDQKSYAREAQRRTLESHFERVGVNATILPTAGIYWRIRYALSAAPLVTLIIPTRNGLELLQSCVDTIYQRTTYRPFEILIVDNQSDDPATLKYLARLEKDRGLRVLRYDAPFNYAAINNFAVQHARGEIIGLLNNDLEIITPDWLEEMVSYAVQPEIGAVGAMLYYPDNTIQHAGVILGLGGTRGVAGHAYQQRPPGYSGQATRALLCQNLSAVTAACLVIRRRVFDEVGGLDETNLAIAFNDIDLCLRLRQRGYRNIWTPYAELYHKESASRGYEETPEKLARFEKESDYMRRRWEPLLWNDPAYNPNLALDREAFMLAFPPRVRKPWLIKEIQDAVAAAN